MSRTWTLSCAYSWVNANYIIKTEHDGSVQNPHSRLKVKTAISQGGSSSGSTRTVVGENPGVEVRKTGIKRRGTHVAVVELSWLDCLKAVLAFNTKWLRRKLAATVEWADVEGPAEKV